jgi:long-chain acyl-CoA synthetase
VRLAVADETGRLLGAGDVGTIVVQGEHVSAGSWTADGVTRRTAPWLDTGDVGRIDEDGYVYLLGRAGDIINVGGEKVAPLEVEEVLSNHPAVREAACIGVPDPNGLVGSRVKAFLVPTRAEDDPPRNDELESFVRVRLEPHKIPIAYEWIDEIPKNELGKPRRHLLREQSAAQRDG